MRYRELCEAIRFHDLINTASDVLAQELNKRATQEVQKYEQLVTGERRKDLGYAPYDDHPKPPLKPFDAKAFRDENEKDEWYPYTAILNNFDKWNNTHSHFAFALMGVASKVLTRMTRDHVRTTFGDPITVQGMPRPVDEIEVHVWWQALIKSMEKDLGYFSTHGYNVNKKSQTEITIFVKADRSQWEHLWEEACIGLATGEGYDFEPTFVAPLIDTFAHEYAHFEQALREPHPVRHTGFVSRQFKNAKGHSRKGRGAPYDETDPATWTGQNIEIAASAQGLAAELAHRLNARYRTGYYSSPREKALYYNEDIMGFIRDAAQGMIPYKASRRFIYNDESMTAAERIDVKKRYIRDYVRALQTYLKAVPPDFIGEMAIPSAHMATQTYYHGTKSEAAARNILKNGIKPPEKPQGRTLLSPVAGRLYLTSNLKYAIIYAIGGDMAGHEASPEMIKEGRYGYVFVIDGKKVIADVQPDEDSVGEAIYIAAAYAANERNHDIRQSTSAGHDNTDNLKSNLHDDLDFQRQLLAFAQDKLTPGYLQKIKRGEYAYFAAGGKRLLNFMPDWMKQKLIELGAHVGYAAPIIPDEAWRIDKTKISRLSRFEDDDGEEFWDLAKRIR